ncbi:MAG TPA: alkaline phosphatase PhoX [Marmoricola sp.]|nr:alkaline phosphatase PhoX [Marmoricola sp.]
MTIERRTLLKTGTVAALAGGPFAGFAALPAEAHPHHPRHVELVPVPDRRDGKVRLHLPKGFGYRSFHDTEETVVLDDGTVLPGRHDGMGAFWGPKGNSRLVRNHEINVTPGQGAFGDPEDAYDPMAGGGTTSIQITPHGHDVWSRTSLNGTLMNCSGGVMPWGSWVTCEETVNGPDVAADFTGTPNTELQKPHGYIFEVPARGRSNRKPIKAAGRFAHEAVAFDPREGRLYLTEDNFGFASGYYRYTPRRHPMKCGRLDDHGVLEMLKIKGRRGMHLEGHQHRGRTYDVEWVRIDEPDFEFDYTPGQEAPTSNNDAIVFVGNQGRAKGAALFSRLEGQVYDRGVVYFCSTQGGGPRETVEQDDAGGFGNGHGQVWGYDTRRQTLTCVYQSPGPEVLDFPDNVTASPRGTLVVCEDNDDDNYLRGLSRRGKLWDIALNRLTGADGAPRYDDEFAGSTFSHNGRTLFVNIQASRGMSFAIWGPWRRIGV